MGEMNFSVETEIVLNDALYSTLKTAERLCRMLENDGYATVLNNMMYDIADTGSALRKQVENV
jgi:hypothetical protein